MSRQQRKCTMMLDGIDPLNAGMEPKGKKETFFGKISQPQKYTNMVLVFQSSLTSLRAHQKLNMEQAFSQG